MGRFLPLMLLAACSLDEGGSYAAFDAGSEASTTDGPRDAVNDMTSEPSPPLPCTTDASACISALQPGWAPVAFEASRTLGCPANFAVTSDVVSNPQAQAGACSCNCVTTAPPSCGVGVLNGSFGNTNQCNGGNNPPFTITTDGQCVDWGGTFGLVPYHNWTKLGLTAGTCTSSATPDTTKVARADMRTCMPGPMCAEDVCAGNVPAGFQACIVHDADVPCPPGPFSNRAGVVGDAVQLSCAACAGCSATGTGCGAATVDYYANANCTGSLATDNVNGSCVPSASSVTGISHFKYTGTVQNPTCAPGASTPTPDLTMKRTVCCR